MSKESVGKNLPISESAEDLWVAGAKRSGPRESRRAPGPAPLCPGHPEVRKPGSDCAPTRKIRLRDLRPEDRQSIERILRAVGVFREPEVQIGLELVDETFQPGPSTDYRWFVADRAGAVVGFACFGPVPLTEGTFDLYWIAVEPGSQGSTVAEMLDEAVTTAVRSLGARWLLAETSSLPEYGRAHRFYARRGYRLVGKIEDFYRPGDDRLTFGKRLDRD
jgi:GNAT superfamily N-acetyltransferase